MNKIESKCIQIYFTHDFQYLAIERLFRIKTKRKFAASSSCCISHKHELIRKHLFRIVVLKCRNHVEVILFYYFLFLWTPSMKIFWYHILTFRCHALSNRAWNWNIFICTYIKKMLKWFLKLSRSIMQLSWKCIYDI